MVLFERKPMHEVSKHVRASSTEFRLWLNVQLIVVALKRRRWTRLQHQHVVAKVNRAGVAVSCYVGDDVIHVPFNLQSLTARVISRSVLANLRGLKNDLRLHRTVLAVRCRDAQAGFLAWDEYRSAGIR